MSTRHFIALADALIGSGIPWSDDQYQVLAEFCKLQNPAFDRERWFNYIRGECGPNGGSRK